MKSIIYTTAHFYYLTTKKQEALLQCLISIISIKDKQKLQQLVQITNSKR